ncbi:YbhB/YbcL family Raf kinase inhibitor-like protein [Luteimonas sp. MC1572]|uniref:YbhB/YbcL family Raf kinase inhibitor-like protein n=1 Tax=Luteimonas sp. MC1572 TaxID=2799325 RepID=UPI0018F0EA0A|nr:YbhB/YbcL family Raf kinase inhibitor-like protein [Luteimonas sp. MC1572]MBJ6980867.1 YbhB/YbcL family Raf kinase inhibitor-like protein [Luteimonas sp. MC1572]QQO02227.1 YbhB/YbcL family Raf kinase inhibitor-like protein [Luteimonas sp. MC1572]
MTATRQRAVFSIALAVGLASLAACQGEEASLAFDGAETRSAAVGDFALRSTSFADGESIPRRHSAYGDDISPALAWQPVEGAASYALVMEDPDADRPAPYVHWVAWNIPATATALDEGLRADARLAAPAGMQQGLNDRGSTGYFGPKPPAGSGLHHYHVQLFALDTTLDIAADADRNALVKAMRGHVLGRARLVGTYAAPDAARP